MPCLRHTSFTGMPASASFRIDTICVSVNRLLRMGTSLGLSCQEVLFIGVSDQGKVTESDVLENIFAKVPERKHIRLGDIEGVYQVGNKGFVPQRVRRADEQVAIGRVPL